MYSRMADSACARVSKRWWRVWTTSFLRLPQKLSMGPWIGYPPCFWEVSMGNRFEMFTMHQIMVRMRQGDRDRVIARSRLKRCKKLGAPPPVHFCTLINTRSGALEDVAPPARQALYRAWNWAVAWSCTWYVAGVFPGRSGPGASMRPAGESPCRHNGVTPAALPSLPPVDGYNASASARSCAR